LLYEISRDQELQAKIFQEIELIYPENGQIEQKHLANIPLLKACLKESMR
jgi:hypothetical protein